jgi:serine/threonine protein kinase
MDAPKLCQNCQVPLAADAPRGLCPSCLMKVAMATGTVAGQEKPGFTPPSTRELGLKFPQLEIIELIGRGGMGAVYKARQKELDRIVALKILPPGIGDDAAFAERFAREAKALARLNHPGIVTIHDFGRADGLYFFVMEFVDGVNLRQLLASARVSPREALAIVPQICDALQFAHDQGIVHRDIKPENILLDRRGRVKVADFGLAKIVEGRAGSPLPAASASETSDGAHGVTRPASELTEAGKVMGTPAYMAPEQVAHPADVDHRADIYALGVVFYQMLTGELPGKTLEPPSSKVQIDVRLDEVVLRALEKKLELRYQQVSEIKTMVETIAATPDPSTGRDKVAQAERGGREAGGEKQSDNLVTPAAARSSCRPRSLIVVAGLFMLSGSYAAWDIGSGLHNHSFIFNFGVLGLSVGIGLLRFRPRWRIVALIMIWLPFILGACLGIAAMFGQFTITSHARFYLGHELTGFARLVAIIAACTLMPMLLVWMSRVLTRSAVKTLFQRSAPDRAWIEWAALPVAILIAFVLSNLAGPSGSTQSRKANLFPEVSDSVPFGPEMEQLLPYEGAGSPGIHFISFKSGQVLTPPLDKLAAIGKDALADWMRQSGADAVAELNNDGSSRLFGFDQCSFFGISSTNWRNTNAESLITKWPGNSRNLAATHSVGSDALPETFLFKTADGSLGLGQITSFTDNPRGLKLRYKLVQHARTTAASTEPGVVDASAKPGDLPRDSASASASVYSYGPEINRVIQSRETGTNLFLDLDTGQLLTPPKDIRALFNESYTKRNSWELQSDPRAVRMGEWLRSSGANLMLSDGMRGLERLEIREAMAFAPTVVSNDIVIPFGFDQADARYLATRIKPMLESSGNRRQRTKNIWLLQPSFDPRLNTRQDSFCFRTHEGTVGILQILNPEENPPGVRVRYKLLQTGKQN